MTCTDTSCHNPCLDTSASPYCAFCHVIGENNSFWMTSHKNTCNAWIHSGFSYGTIDLTFVQMTCNNIYIQTSLVVNGQLYTASDNHFFQMPSQVLIVKILFYLEMSHSFNTFKTMKILLSYMKQHVFL